MGIWKLVTLLLSFFLLFSSNPAPVMVDSRCLPTITHELGNATRIQTYIVHVQKPRGFEFSSFKDRKDWYMSFLPNATLYSGEPRMLYAYTDVISGFAARLTQEEVKAMESMDEFVRAYPEKKYVAQTTYTPKYLELDSQFDDGDGLWHRSNYGNGIIIGVIDSGIKPTHPSFLDDPNSPMPPPPSKWSGTCYWNRPICNNKLIGAVGFRYGRNSDPIDDDGHGTHVASIAAGNFVDHVDVLGNANSTMSGMAPRAHLAVYKVLFKGADGVTSGTESDILAAINQAIRDGVDVLSMSIGFPSLTVYESSISKGSFAAISKGIVPVAAVGNDGPFQSIITNDAPWVLTIGASSFGRRIRATVRLGNGVELDGESAYQPGTYVSTQLPLVYPGASNAAADLACSSNLADFNVSGNMVICLKGTIENVEKGVNVKKAGGAAMIVLSGPIYGNTTDADPHVLPASHLGFDDSLLLADYVRMSTNPTAEIIFKGAQFGGRRPALASFSSRGPSVRNGNILKPDVVAPGENILAAWPFEVGPNPTGTTKTFNFLSGTSMATPHVSGIAALLKSMHPSWSPAAIKSAMITTASNLDNEGEPLSDEYNYGHQFASLYGTGAGHVKPLAASDPGLVYDLDYHNYVPYLCGAGFEDWQVSAILQYWVNCSQVKRISPEQLNYPSISVSIASYLSPKNITRTLTNVEDSSSVYQVDVKEPKGVSVVVSPATLKFSGLDDKQTFTVTLSIKGNTQKSGFTSAGRVNWVSGKHVVKTLLLVTFI